MSRGRGRLLALALAVAALAVATAVVWIEDDGDAPRTRPAVAALDGRALFAAKGCAVCHFGPGASSGVGIGPDLRRVADVAGSRVPGLDAAAYLRQSIADPGAFVASATAQGAPYDAMPRLAVSPAELDALVAYLLSRPGRRGPSP